MWEDPIVSEVHRAREKLAAECNYDIKSFFVGLRKRQLIQRKQTEPIAETDQCDHSGSEGVKPSEAAPAD